MGKINWFPGHMAKAFNALNRIVKGVDMVLEVRDARIPLSSINSKLEGLLKGKRHIVVLNKADLISKSSRQAAIKQLQQQGLLALPASSSDPRSTKQLLRAAVGWIQRDRAQSELSIMLLVGLPNSGKSSLINALKASAKAAGVLGAQQAYQKRAAVGPTPGLTRQVSGFQVAAEPPIYVLDTPGVMMPAVPSDEVGFKLALAGAIKDSVVGEEAIVRFLISQVSSNPRHIAALQAAQQPGYRLPGSSSSRSGYDTAARKRQEAKARELRSALAAVAAAGGLARASAASSLQERLQDNLQDVAPWHPGDEDAYDASDAQLDTGAYLRLLQAFRAGDLGQYMLDDVE
ncbi:P-loop containing nucleoside triphosphate hydrolase protein [Scenedesmus sp. NREL 46B-D3]|nr:P-loop containing nucleoside triphosphate hydrolase protein [Scenedesmus sp. NREL 46B-D3]